MNIKLRLGSRRLMYQTDPRAARRWTVQSSEAFRYYGRTPWEAWRMATRHTAEVAARRARNEDDPTTASVESVEWPMNEGDIQDGGW